MLMMVVGGGGLLLAALVLIAAAQRLGYLPTAAGAFILAAVTFSILFKVLPPIPVRWGDVWPATLLCAGARVLAGELLALYGVWFSDSRSTYGALGGVLAVMLWMYVVSQVLFFGAELCKVGATRRAVPGAPERGTRPAPRPPPQGA